MMVTVLSIRSLIRGVTRVVCCIISPDNLGEFIALTLQLCVIKFLQVLNGLQCAKKWLNVIPLIKKIKMAFHHRPRHMSESIILSFNMCILLAPSTVKIHLDLVFNFRFENQHLFISCGSKQNEVGSVSSWCGWHTDHGSLTGNSSSLWLKKCYHQTSRSQHLL